MARRRSIDPERLKALVAENWSRPDIARRFRVSRGTVDARCRELGLSTNGRGGDRCREKLRRAYRRSLYTQRETRAMTEGIRQRIRAARMGWIITESFTEARLLQAFWEAGRFGLANSEVLERAGLRTDGGAGTNALASLKRRGLLACVGRRKVGRYRLKVWSLAEGVRPRQASLPGAESAGYDVGTAREPKIYRVRA